MQKEVFIAIFFGSILGIMVAFGVWRANSALKNGNEQKRAQNTQEVTNKSEGNNNFELSIQKPQDRYAFGQDLTDITGITKSGAYVAISSERNDDIILTNGGEFEYEIGLDGGINDIFIFAFDDKEIVSDSLLLLYSSSLDIGDTQNDSAEDLIEKRKNAAANPFISLLGTITDITENSMQIQTEKGIKQISLAENTTYANIIDSAKEVEFSDLAIGDNVIAIGRINDDEILNAERILVSSKYTQASRKAVLGSVKEISRSNLIISDGFENSFELNLASSTDYYTKEEDLIKKIARTEITEDGLVFVVYSDAEGELNARSVFLFDKE